MMSSSPRLKLALIGLASALAAALLGVWSWGP
jgi:hypothetical protein